MLFRSRRQVWQIKVTFAGRELSSDGYAELCNKINDGIRDMDCELTDLTFTAFPDREEE